MTWEEMSLWEKDRFHEIQTCLSFLPLTLSLSIVWREFLHGPPSQDWTHCRALLTSRLSLPVGSSPALSAALR